jgi:hypothetical protein
MQEAVGPGSTCGRELLRGWWRPIGLMVSFIIFSVSPEYFGYTLVFLVPFFYTHTAGIVCNFTSTTSPTNRAKFVAFNTHETRLTFPFAGTSGFFVKPICTKLLDQYNSLR